MYYSFFTPQALVALNDVVDNHLDEVQRTPRSTVLRGVAAMEPFLDLSRLARISSSLIGIPVPPMHCAGNGPMSTSNSKCRTGLLTPFITITCLLFL